MAVLYISEYPASEMNNLPVAKEPPLVDQTVAIGGGSLQSSTFSGATGMIRINVDATCSIKIGANPTATATNKRLPADATEYFLVNPGDRVAVITNI